MSNTRKARGTTQATKTREFKTWDQYVEESDHPDFVLPTPDGEIRVKAPTGQQSLDAYRLSETGDIVEQLRVICGDAFDDIFPLVMDAPAGVLPALVTDIMEHFGVSGEASASSK